MLIDYLEKQIGWSRATFGPSFRWKGILKHIRKELREIKAEPASLEEWIDVVILALDGAWRAGNSPAAIVDMLCRKQARNFARRWPPPGPDDKATEHIRDHIGDATEKAPFDPQREATALAARIYDRLEDASCIGIDDFGVPYLEDRARDVILACLRESVLFSQPKPKE
jgi:hypothetical protein